MKKKVTYEEIEQLVKEHQRGVSDATATLLENYEGYFSRFLQVLCKGKINVANNTQRRFVGSFISNEDVRNNIHQYAFNGYIGNTLAKVAHNLRNRLQGIDEDDIKQEMVCIFIDLASKHNGSAPFASYLSFYFPLRLNTLVTKWIKELDARNYHEVMYDEDMVEAASYDDIELDPPTYFIIQSATDTAFDENWVNGDTCGSVFDGLTTYERRLIKWYYEWRMFDYTGMAPDLIKAFKKQFKRTEQEIADGLGCSRKTINLKRNDAKRRILECAEDIHIVTKQAASVQEKGDIHVSTQ